MGETIRVKNKRPFAFYVCSMAFAFERFAFYAVKWLLAMLVVASVADGGLGMTIEDGARISGYLVSAAYLAPMIGGVISDRFIGAKYMVPVGMILMGIGYLVGWKADSVAMLYLMISLVAIGTACFKCQTNAITGKLFDDPRDLDGAFSVQYSFVNFGSFFGTTIIGMVAMTHSYSLCFLICAIIMFVNAAWFLAGWKSIGSVGTKPFKVGAVKESVEVNSKKAQPLTTTEKKRVAAIILVSSFSVIFWLCWYLAYMPVYYYWGGDNGMANWYIGNFKISTAWFDSLNAFCCISMGPILAAFWNKMAKSTRGDLSMFKKTALGMMLLGVSYVVFALADVVRGDNLANIMWIVAFGVILSLGEMVFSPLGNSFISKFAPAKLLSVMMAVWVLSSFVASLSYSKVYALTLKFEFVHAYLVIAAVVIVSGIILWLLDKKLNSLVEE